MLEGSHHKMKTENYFHTISSIPSHISFDAILVLGGGVPEDIKNPPIYTQERCKAASQVYHNAIKSKQDPPKVLTLSAGTAHLPQALSFDGLPIWESTASSAYLIHTLEVKPEDVYAETTSYDTISNAFFARLNFCDIAQWKKLLIITNEFHMDRTKLIFDWIFHAPMNGVSGGNSEGGAKSYELYYLAVPDVGLTESAIKARKEKEQKSANTVKNILSQKYSSIEHIFDFLTKEHSFYTASKLVQRGMDDGSKSNQDAVGKLIQDSYGGVSSKKSHGIGGAIEEYSMYASLFLFGTLFGITVMFLKTRSRGKHHLP